MKDVDNCNQNKILKIINYIYYCALIFGNFQKIYFLTKHYFYFFAKITLLL
jgi:hypothetical protein